MAFPDLAREWDQEPAQEPASENESRVRLKVLPPSETRVSEDETIDRPRTRADCQPGGDHYHRPCPYVACRHNLFLDVGPAGDVIGDAEADPWTADPDHSCSLDLTEQYPSGLVEEDIAGVMGAGVEEVEDIQRRTAERLRPSMEEYADRAPEGEGGSTLLGDLCSQFQGGVEKGLRDEEDDRSGRVLPDRFYILEPPPARRGATRLFQRHGSDTFVPDAEYQRAVWKVYERSSRSRAEELAAAADATWAMFVDVLLGIAQAQLSHTPSKRFGRRGA